MVIQFTSLVGVLFHIFKMPYSIESTAMLKITYKKFWNHFTNIALVLD